MKVTLKKIAEDTGFSISTVSRVLNNSDKISSDTHVKVLTSAAKLGYNVGKVEESKSKKNLNIALLATGFHEGEFYSSFFHGLNKSAKKNNVRLFLNALLSHEDDLIKLTKDLASEYFDGFILFIPEFLIHDYNKLASALPKDMPIVSNSLIENPVFPTLTFDSYSGGYLAAEHLKNNGYKKVGIILGPAERSESRFRKNGFIDYISQQKDIDLLWTCTGDFTFESGVKACKKFHKEGEKPDAIFATNDSMATGFLQKAKSYGYAIPDDVALIGYDDLPNNLYTNPTISSIHTDYEKLGDATIKALLERIDKSNLKSNLLSLVPVSVSHKGSS